MSSSREQSRALLPNPSARWLATFFGSGLAPFMPGTFGSIAAVVPLFFLTRPQVIVFCAIGVVVATLLSAWVAKKLPPKGQGGDPGWFVLDEAAGVWLAAAWPGSLPLWQHLLLALLLFRVFDISKPPPCRRLELVGGGYGIVLDDLAAGVYALAILIVGELLLP